MDNPQTLKPVAPYPRGARGILCDISAAFILLTRIPIPWARLTALPPDMTRSLWAFPLVGFCVALVGALLLMVSSLLILPEMVGATLAVLAMVFATGAFHEDGLADVADGFGGGLGRARKLEIMRDSRIGTYGSIAVVMALLLRILALGHMEVTFAVAALLVSGVVSRFWILALLKLLPPARTDGTGTVAGVPDTRQIFIAGGLSLAVAVLLLPMAFVMPMIVTAVLAFLAVAFISHRQVGGYSGDVLGAVQQVSEIAILICLLSLSRGV